MHHPKIKILCALLRENENKPESEQSNQEGASTSDTQNPTDQTAQRILPSIPSESPPDLISPVPDKDTATTSTSSEMNVSRKTEDNNVPSAMEGTPSEPMPSYVTTETISGQTPEIMPMPEASGGTVLEPGQIPTAFGKFIFKFFVISL
jgi:hypothetical protein